MALTVTQVQSLKPRLGKALVEKIVTIAFDSSYPTGGEALAAADLGLTAVRFFSANPSSGYVFEYDYTNSKIKAYYGDNNNASDGPLIEVPDTTNLSTISTRAVVKGY